MSQEEYTAGGCRSWKVSTRFSATKALDASLPGIAAEGDVGLLKMHFPYKGLGWDDQSLFCH